jgi:hypothetical protein
MTDLQRINNWFDSGRLVRPSSDVINFIDLVRALAHLTGAEGMETGPGVKELCRKIGQAENYIFVLVDGLGVDLIQKLPEKSFLRTHMVGQLQSVFLSTTATALSALATGQWPCAHGVPGWWTYLEESDISVITLPFKERTTERPLEEFGISMEVLFPMRSMWPRLRYDTLSVLPSEIVGSTYSRYALGDTASTGYVNMSGAIQTVLERILSTQRSSFLYLYLPQLDDLMHEKGTDHIDVRKFLLTLSKTLGNMVEVLPEQTRIIISADHGMINVPDEHQFIISVNDPLRSHLRCPPTGEPTVPIFHVREGHEKTFASEFTSRFGDHFALLIPEEIERLHLLGPGPLSQVMKRRLGQFIGIPPHPATFRIQTYRGRSSSHIGRHGGLSKAEMYIPLILA